VTHKQTIPFAALALLASAATPSQAQALAARIAGTPQLYAVQGEVSVGRPTAYVTFRTAEDLTDPRGSMVVRVSGASGRTYNADDGQRGRPRTCFRSALKPYQRTPETRRLRPGVTYRVQFFHRASPNAKRTLIHTVRLKARSFRPQHRRGGGVTAPSPCRAF
jgi:hypothetical protein